MGFFSWLTGKKDSTEQAPAAEPKPEAGSRKPEAQAERDDVTVEQLVAMVQSKNGAARVDGARGLLEKWRNGDLDAAKELAARVGTLFDDSEPTVRQVALGAVRLMRKPENLEKHASAVLALLADKAAPVRTAAVWAANRLPGDVARTQVRALLQSTDEPLRFDAATALAEVGDPAGLPELVRALHEGHRRQEALSSMMTLGDPACLKEIAALWDDEEAGDIGDFDRTMMAAAMARFGDQRGAEHLIERAASHADDTPIAVEWLGRLGVEDAQDVLEELAADHGNPARGAALRALGRLKAEGAEDLLHEVAEDAEAADDLRMDAAEGLAEIGSERALATLRDLSVGEGELPALCRELLAELAAGAAVKAAATEQPAGPEQEPVAPAASAAPATASPATASPAAPAVSPSAPPPPASPTGGTGPTNQGGAPNAG